MAHESSLGFAWPFTQNLRVAGESSFGFAWPFTQSLRVAHESSLGFAWPFTQSSCGLRVWFGICMAVHTVFVWLKSPVWDLHSRSPREQGYAVHGSVVATAFLKLSE